MHAYVESHHHHHQRYRHEQFDSASNRRFETATTNLPMIFVQVNQAVSGYYYQQIGTGPCNNCVKSDGTIDLTHNTEKFVIVFELGRGFNDWSFPSNWFIQLGSNIQEIKLSCTASGTSDQSEVDGKTKYYDDTVAISYKNDRGTQLPDGSWTIPKQFYKLRLLNYENQHIKCLDPVIKNGGNN
ncbi:MAG: hypothetical protein ABI376_11700 [Caulobacteraceae bacterium]